MAARNPDFELRPYALGAAATDAALRFGAIKQAGREKKREAIAGMYQSLLVTDGCIRVLRVCTRDENDASLNCRLHVADLRSTPAPSYKALSYVWGRRISSHSRITCNGVAFPVTSNCYSALRHLHAKNGTFDIWVDAICINQEDQDEKKRQIKLMGEIYSKAATTYVWLGPGDAATERVAAFLGRVGFLEHFFEDSSTRKHILRKPKVWAAASQYVRGRCGLGRSMVPNISFYRWKYFLCLRWAMSLKDDECTHDELLRYFDCKWLTRIWTYQEVILSPNPVVVRGSTHISWDRLLFSVTFLASIDHYCSMIDYYDTAPDSSDLRHWISTMAARELYRANVISATECEYQIFAYWKFCRLILTTTKWLCRLGWLIFVCTIFAVPWMLLQKGNIPGRRLLWVPVDLLIVVFKILIFGLRRNSSQYEMPTSALSKMERRIRSSVHEKILDTLGTRDATEPRDISFGLHSILEGLPGDTEMPKINYDLPLSSVYFQLTQFLLHDSRSLQVLNLAARYRYQRAPSWVPDYSRVGVAESIDANPGNMGNVKKITSRWNADQLSRTVMRNELEMISICKTLYGTKLPYHYHAVDDKILVVKGTLLGRITAVTAVGRLFPERRSLVETALYQGLTLEGCRTGDKIILIVGFHRPLIVRDDGKCVKIVGAANLSHKRKDIRSLSFSILRIKDYIEYGETWHAHDKERKEEWKREHGWTDSEAEPHALQYLQDILIS